MYYSYRRRSDTAVKSITVGPGYALYVPNAFTPNNDGTNDEFKAVGIGVTEFRLWVFDRWGNMIFYSDDVEKGWDGKVERKSGELVQRDVYVWKAIVKDIREKDHTLMGKVTVVR